MAPQTPANPQTTAPPPPGASDDPMKQLLSMLQMLAGGDKQDGQPNIFEALLNFFKMIAGGQDTDAQQFSGPDNTTGRSNQDFRTSARENFNTGNILDLSDRLKKMREENPNIQAASPVEGSFTITSGFGHRDAVRLPNGGLSSTEHKGYDIAMSDHSHPPINSTMPGVVVGAGWVNGYGNTVEVMDQNGERWRYGHLASINVKVGESVYPAGDPRNKPLGIMGETGAAEGVHLHLEERNTQGTGVVRPHFLGRDFAKGDHSTGEQNRQFAMQQHGNNGTEVAANTSRPDLDALLANLNNHDPSYASHHTGTRPAQDVHKAMG